MTIILCLTGAASINGQAVIYNTEDITSERIRHRCQQLGLAKNISSVEMLPLRSLLAMGYADELRVLVCDVPYTGSNTWLSALTNGASNEYTHMTNRKLSAGSKSTLKIKMDNIGLRMKSYQKVLVTRHPLERLVSIYLRVKAEDFYGSKPLRLDYMETLKSYVRLLQDRGSVSVVAKFQFTFSQFIKFVGHSPAHFYHWRGIYDTCLPCTIDYDLVAKFDWDEAKKEEFGKKLKLSNETALYKTLIEQRSPKNWHSYYDSIDKHDIDILRELYKYEFDLFGYDWPVL